MPIFMHIEIRLAELESRLIPPSLFHKLVLRNEQVLIYRVVIILEADPHQPHHLQYQYQSYQNSDVRS